MRDRQVQGLSESDRQSRGTLETCVWGFLNAFEDHLRECRWDLRIDQGRRGGKVLKMLHEDSHHGIAAKRGDACGHFVQNDAQGIQVTALVAWKSLCLFW
jgi:hypothetical protein